MNYSQILSIFRQTALLVQPPPNGGTFMHGAPSDESFLSNRANYPFLNLLPFNIQKDLSARTVSFPTMRMRAMVLDTLPSSPEQREVLLRQVEKLLNKFFTLLNTAEVENNGYVMPLEIQNLTFAPFYKENSSIASGYEASFTLNTLTDCYDEDLDGLDGEGPFLVYEDGGRILL